MPEEAHRSIGIDHTGNRRQAGFSASGARREGGRDKGGSGQRVVELPGAGGRVVGPLLQAAVPRATRLGIARVSHIKRGGVGEEEALRAEVGDAIGRGRGGGGDPCAGADHVASR